MMEWAMMAMVLALSVGEAAGPDLGSPGPGPGDPAPDFSLQGSDGKTYTLSQFKGRQAVVIAWFPKAFTGG